MVTDTRFQCTAAAAETWRQLLSCYRWKRLHGITRDPLDSSASDNPAREGADWSEWGSRPPKSFHSDLATEARLMICDAESKMMLLEARGPDQQAAVALARRLLGGQRLSDVRERFGLGWCGVRDERDCPDGCTAHQLMEKLKEWVNWALDTEDTPEPEWCR